MNTLRFILIIIALALVSGVAAAKSPPYFEGSLSLGPNGCQQSNKCNVKSDFGYVDQYHIGWKVQKGFVTDGASIPRWAQWFAGDPWDPSYLQAAVLHDWYSKSERPVNGWLQTQRMFREVLLQSGVSLGKANLLYAGVLVGSGKWIYRLEGNNCSFNDPDIMCLQQVGKFVLEKEDSVWGTQQFQTSFSKFKANVAGLAAASAEDVEALVAKEVRNPIYILEKDGVIGSRSRPQTNLQTE